MEKSSEKVGTIDVNNWIVGLFSSTKSITMNCLLKRNFTLNEQDNT